MAVTTTNTLLRENVMGCEKVMDWKIALSGTYVTGGFSLTPATLGLDTIDFVSTMIDGSTTQTNGVALVAPNLTSNLWLLFGSGANAGDMLSEVGNGDTVTDFTFIARVWGVA